MFNRNFIYHSITIFLSVFILFVVFLPLYLYADPITGACDPLKQICNPVKFDTIQDLFAAVLNIAATIGSVFIVLGIIYSGFLFVSARGNSEELTKAKRAFTYTVIGAILVLGAWAFSVAISKTINEITTVSTP